MIELSYKASHNDNTTKSKYAVSLYNDATEGGHKMLLNYDTIDSDNEASFYNNIVKSTKNRYSKMTQTNPIIKYYLTII